MTHIASPQNPRLKALRRLQTKRERERSGRFLVEGEDLIAAAARAGRRTLEGYRVAGTDIGGEEFVDVEPQALAAVSTLGSGTRVIGVYEQRWEPRPQGPLCLYLHGVKDPGNVGTALRSAQAFGASCVALGPGCADPHSPKAVRASMGAIFAVAVARVSDVGELPGERIALVADAEEILRGPGEGTRGDGGAEEGAGLVSATGTVTLLVGAEREGLPEEVVAACERAARIAIESQSLNAAMAATVALYEMTRRPSRVTAS
ncbi:MAG TPA: RNA methyltransferase [Solirubrobacteraceae bacterium]|jgi:TrmH family RNA methyltransferase